MESNALTPQVVEKDLDYYLRIVRGDFSELEEANPVKSQYAVYQKNIVIVLSGETLGQGKLELGKRLMAFFLQALINNRVKPKAIILLNNSVQLAAKGSDILSKLIILEEQGLKIMVCSISADDYGLADKIKVGSLSDMDAICEQILSAWKVISL